MKIGFIGTGVMGSALAKAAAKAPLEKEIYLADANAKAAEALAEQIGATCSDSETICRECDLVFLGVKPQVLPAVLREIAPFVKERKQESFALVSMAAGVSTETIASYLTPSAPIIRIMPNTPVLVEKGVVVYCTKSVDEALEQAFVKALSMAGVVEKIDEGKIDAASALHGCGPAFVFLFIEALSDGAVNCGLSRDAAIRFAAATVAGSGELVLQTGKHPAALKDGVCSPGGTTIEGVRALEEAGFRGAVMDAVVAAYEKTLALGKGTK